MSDLKQGYREVRNKAGETVRRMDGDEDLADKAGNLGDDIRDGLGNAGDDIRDRLDDMGDDARRAVDGEPLERSREDDRP